MKNKFFKIETPAGRPESIGIMSKLHGPWIITSQHNEVPSLWTQAIAMYPTTDTFELVWGMKIYQQAHDGVVAITELCGYWFDTSD